MKKSILFFGALAFISSAAIAQPKDKKAKQVPTAQAPAPTPVPAAVPQQTTPNQNVDLSMKFKTEEHNFGNIPEGPAVSTDFEFENKGKEPIILSGVQASCGCTTPTWTKEPVAPGKKGKITATYNTQGRPGNFVKTITVNSNVGTKIIKITGVVEKAPDASVPADNGSIMKH
jgi:hypothetical protein